MYPDAFFVLDEKRGNPGEPYGVLTPHGWTVIGPHNWVKTQESSQVFLMSSSRPVCEQPSTDQELTVQLERFWKTDFGDSILSHRPSLSVDDINALDIMERSVKFCGGHYQLALPWKYSPPYLPNNRVLARLKYLKRKLLADDDIYKKYCATVKGYLDNEYAEKIPKEDLHVENKPVWYLPHHGVIHPHKPEKLRVVYDCAAKYRNTSLNDQLYQGPDLTNSLLGVLTRFRQNPIAIVADIEAMFHHVLVDPKDQDALRFLWWPNDDLSQEPEEHRMRVHLFGATSSPSCASFSLRRTAEDNRHHFKENVINSALKNFYVDDFLKSTKTVEEAKDIVHAMTNLMSKGGFYLTKWLSNRKEVLQEIPASERAKSISLININLDDLPSEKTLGLLWDVNKDKFTFKINLKEKPVTRRGILSVSSSIYDPLGFVAPVILPAKKLLQDLTRQKLDWDEEIDEHNALRWNNWLKDIPNLVNVTVERCIILEHFEEIKSFQLHHFADASEISYGAVSYSRVEDVKDNIHCSLLMGKSRLAPIKVISIPRLELSAAALSVKLDQMLKEELEVPVDQSVFWTDSTTVLGYIVNTIVNATV